MPAPEDILRALGGGAVKEGVSYPTPEDVAFARKYDMTYGRPAAGIDTPGQRMGVLPTMDDVMAAGNENMWSNFRMPMKQADRDREYAAWLATNRSPVSALGYNPTVNTTTPVTTDTPRLTVGGFFMPGADRIWYEQRQPSTVVHESMHRGLNELRKSGVNTKVAYSPEELMVRALMHNHFGDIEKYGGDIGDKQVEQGKALAKKDPNSLKVIEDLAAQEIKKRHPMGPN